MHRFFVSPKCIDAGKVLLEGDQAHQIVNVLRLELGDRVTLLDNSGMEYLVRLIDLSAKRVSGEVEERFPCLNEPQTEITLCQALLKGDKFDWVLQKCTEIGVARFVPFLSERCVADKSSDTRRARWQKVITEAAEQSKRGRIPVLAPTISFEQACEQVDGESLLLWEEERALDIKTALAESESARRITVFIGPEGGFSPREAALARSRGIPSVTLGARVLRAETAGLVTAAVLLYERGELGSSH